MEIFLNLISSVSLLAVLLFLSSCLMNGVKETVKIFGSVLKDIFG